MPDIGHRLPRLSSHDCNVHDLCLVAGSPPEDQAELSLAAGWTTRWLTTWRVAGSEVICPVRDLASMPTTGCQPVRRFTWRTGQRHRPGLQYLVSTGRLHGFESMADQQLLLALDFAGHLVDVVSRPFRLRFTTVSGAGEHTPDFLAVTDHGSVLIDVRPAGRIEDQDRVRFATAGEAASACGWPYLVVTGWKPHILTILDELSAQRRPLADLIRTLNDAASDARTLGGMGYMAVKLGGYDTARPIAAPPSHSSG